MKSPLVFTHILFGGLILALTAYRILAAGNDDLVNFSPLMALAFCGAVYFRASLVWLLPFSVLVVSEGTLNAHYGMEWSASSLVAFMVKLACFGGALGLGLLVARKRSWTKLLGGCLAGSALFYLGTNSLCWLQDPGYAKSIAGWWQCMTVGLPGFLPTWVFFRNSLLSDLLFTGVFVVVLESLLAASGQKSLLPRQRMVQPKAS